ncbi:MAG: hypothetical protein SVW57_01870 [Thermodesulfobacteriota bacterium]|nr:hypothetical protein [Thermodesulfobacteriota bacterium]
MPETARVVLPNNPHHIIQRDYNHQGVLVNDEDYRYYLETP